MESILKNRAFLPIVTLAIACWLSFSAPVKAEVTLLGSDGWEVTVDGSVNTFAVFSSRDTIEDNTQAANSYLGDANANDNTFRVMNGLLPAVFAFNVKAPTINNLTMRSRLGLYPHVHNYNREKNKLGQSNIGSTLDLREVFFNVEHAKYGSMLFGKTLSLYLGKNILTDMTLLGVGAVGAGNTLTGSTTLGRIGFGYVYPNFNAAIRYTTPTFMNAQLTVGVYDPSRIRSVFGDGPDDDVDFSETPEPRLEGELSHSYTFSRIGLGMDSWVNGMYQNAENGTGGPSGSVQAWGLGGGFQAKYQGLTITGSGYWGKGLGSVLMLDTDSLDAGGNTRRNYGYIAQMTYDIPETIAKGFGVGVSLGATYNSATSFEKSQIASATAATYQAEFTAAREASVEAETTSARRVGSDGGTTVTAAEQAMITSVADTAAAAARATARTTAINAATIAEATLFRHNRLIDFMLWNQLTPNLRLVGEVGLQNVRWRDGANVDTYIFSMGGFFFF